MVQASKRVGQKARWVGRRVWLLLLITTVLGAWATSTPAQVPLTPTTFSGVTAVGSTSSQKTITLYAGKAGTITSVVALAGGMPNLDFAVMPITCNVNTTLTVGESCMVSVTFSPRFPGTRQGGVLVMSGSQVLASAPLSGIGQGGLPVLVPGQINTVAGDGQWVYHADGVPATQAPIFLPTGLAVDAAGNLFFCDSSNNRIRRVDAQSGLISTVTGNGSPGSAGDGGQATAAELSNPSGLAMDGAGNLYISDNGNNVIRRVDANSGLIATVAGRIGISSYTGDGGPATSATLSSPVGLALSPGGDLVIADSGNDAVRLLNLASGQIQTIAGTGNPGYNGDGIAATQAKLNEPFGVAVRSDGAIAIADMANERVRLVNTAGTISTIAGDGQRSYGGDSQLATQAQLDGPAAVAFDPGGDLFIADSGNNRVRGVFGNPGTIETLVGNNSQQFAGDGGPSLQASLYGPYALLFDSTGNLWISDMFHNRVREVNGSVLGITYPTMKVGKISLPISGTLYNGGNTNLTLSAPVLNQAALDPGTTSCNQSPMAPMAFCSMGIEFAPTQVGQNVLGSVRWPSDAPNVIPVDNLNGQVLSVEPTTVALASSLNPGQLGQPVTLTATVTSADTGRTGAVTFAEGSNTWCSAVNLDGNGMASCTIQSLSLGSHTFTASYSGDNNNAASTSPAYTEIIKQQPALALAVSTSPAVVTSNVTLTLTAADQSGTPTGSVVFYDGLTALATVNLNGSGIAQWSTQTLAVGTHSLSAKYAGDGANVAGTSNTVSEEIVQANTSTVLASSNGNPTVGTAVTLTANVASNNGPAPTGSVQFNDGPTVLGSASLTANGTASITVSTLPPGNHSLVATYSGDTDNASSRSATLQETVQQIGTTTTLGADANPLNAGATLHLSAVVALAPGATADGTLTGTVTFRDGSGVLGSAPIDANGVATLAVTTLNVGSHALTAVFSGNTNYAQSSSAALTERVQQTNTQVTLSSASATTLAGKPANFTATVTSGTGVPTGSISFHDGSTTLGTAILDAHGVAGFSISSLAPGTHTITAVYGGDSNYVVASSTGLQQSVQLAQPTLTLSGPNNAVDAGTNASFLASLTSPGVAPTGTLKLMDEGTVVSTVNVSANGSFTANTAGLSIGTHTLTVTYSGDSSNSSVTSASITVTVRQANSATTLSTSANPLTQGGPLTLTANVSSDSPNAGGQIRFYDGTALLGTASVGTDGSAVLPASGLGLGTHALTATYTGDTNHAGSTSIPVSELVVQSSSATLNSNNNPAASGQNVTLTARIMGAGSVAATGAVTLRDNGALLVTVPLDAAGLGSFTTNALSVGAHTITVSYAGDQNYAAAGAQLVQTVIDATTQLALTADANPAVYGQPLSVTATVASNGGVATGSVIFTDGGITVGSASLNANGTAVLTLSTLVPGTHALQASYAGDGKASSSSSSPLTLAVKQISTLTLSANSNPAPTLSQISFTATLTNAGAAPASGTISFFDGAITLGTAQLDAHGHATLTLAQMSAGKHSITATYSGDGADFGSNAGVYEESVQLRPTTASVTGSSTDLANPQQITLIAVIRGEGSITPSGTVTFTSGNVTMGQASVDDTGVATITVIFEQTTQPIVASYAGDASYSASQSSSTVITAGQAAQFTLALSAPNVTLVTHQHTTLTVSLGSVKGFTDTISLGCLGLPFAGTCSFTPSQVKLSRDGTATATLILDTGDPLGAGSGTSAALSNSRTTLLCGLPLGLLLGLLRHKERNAARRKLGTLFMFAIAFALTLSATGCSGLSTSGTPPGTYTFKVVGTGQGSGTTQAQTITLVVTQ